jgi:RNA polymerase sigma-70 factor (ECF subfamily)
MDSREATELIRRYEPALLRYFRRNCADQMEAEDLCQETLLGIYRSRERFRRESSESTWVYAIAKNQLRKYYRDSRYQSITERLSPETPGGRQPDIRRLALRLALDLLPESERRLYGLFYEERRPIAEISSILNVPEGTVKYRLFDLRRRLQFRM